MVVNSQDRCGLHNHTAAENWTIGGLLGKISLNFGEKQKGPLTNLRWKDFSLIVVLGSWLIWKHCNNCH